MTARICSPQRECQLLATTAADTLLVRTAPEVSDFHIEASGFGDRSDGLLRSGDRVQASALPAARLGQEPNRPKEYVIDADSGSSHDRR